MGYQNLRDCVLDLEKSKRLRRIHVEIDPHLEAAEIHRRVYQNGGPALLFTRLKGSQFPAVSNLFGTLERTEFIFRDTIPIVQRLVELKVEPARLAGNPFRYLGVPKAAWSLLPKKVRRAPILDHEIKLSDLPKVVCWPKDGGPFVTLPQVYSEHPARPGLAGSNLGMYRIQLAGNRYLANEQVGMHYQIHRGIGVHHAAALERGQRLPVVISVGGPPSLAVAAVMPLPEGMTELGFAGVLSGKRLRLVRTDFPLPIPAEADFAILGTVESESLPEGPFGDHLGYYSLIHDFPALRVARVYHRHGAIWPFTVVGRPPQEDTSFGKFIHELTGPIIPTVLPGVHAVHAVDAAGVHPLLLAIGSERYTPYDAMRQPKELLTQANAILGQGQLSLAKYLLIIARDDNPNLRIDDIEAFFMHLLERIDWRRDVHFQTTTTIDTLDYSGTGLNSGSKVVFASTGPVRRELPREIPADMTMPPPFTTARVCLPGILAIQGPPDRATRHDVDRSLAETLQEMPGDHPIQQFPLLVIVDDASFVAAKFENFLWTVFTRSNPAADIFGIGEFTRAKHFGCTGPLVIDARIKPHHAPVLESDPEVSRRVDALAAPGGPLHGLY